MEKREREDGDHRELGPGGLVKLVGAGDVVGSREWRVG
jgi:hypothetical protein